MNVKGCPNVKCDGKGAIYTVDFFGDGREISSSVRCTKCGIRTESFDSEKEAVEDWNERPTCKWKLDNDKGGYNTECGKFLHIDFKPDDFCCKCGKEIEEVT